jgi:hypothetical protein
MKKPVKTEVVAVRLDRETKERAEERAGAEDRPLSSWVARLIAREVGGPRRKTRQPVMADHQ